MKKPPVSSVMEDYLKAIFELGEVNVKTLDLADELAVSAASVTGMLKKLNELKLVHYEPYYGVSLSKLGRLIALETIRHHRLLETYLMESLGYQWHEVHEEAEKLEHHISEDLEERISEILGHPSYDPHGDPIPSRDGDIPQILGQPLITFIEGDYVEIKRITRQERDVLKYLAEYELKPGNIFTVETCAPFQGPVTVKRDETRVAIAFELAKNIYAAKAKAA